MTTSIKEFIILWCSLPLSASPAKFQLLCPGTSCLPSCIFYIGITVFSSPFTFFSTKETCTCNKFSFGSLQKGKINIVLILQVMKLFLLLLVACNLSFLSQISMKIWMGHNQCSKILKLEMELCDCVL